MSANTAELLSPETFTTNSTQSFQLMVISPSPLEEAFAPDYRYLRRVNRPWEQEVQSFTQLPDNWDSYGGQKVSEEVASAAKRVIRHIQSKGWTPYRVSPSAEDSILIEVSDDPRLVIEVFPDSQAVILAKWNDEKILREASIDEFDTAFGDVLSEIESE